MVEVRNILLIGRTGNGKSTLANVISDSNDFVEGKYGASKTRNTKYKEININETKYRLIDTVGIGDTSLKEEEVLIKIAEAAYISRDGLNQILFVTKDRFTKEEIEVYNILRKVIFDKNIGKYTTIIKTGFPDFRDEDECEKDKEIIMKESKEMEKVINECGGKLIHVDNPSLGIKDQRMVALNKEYREHSRKILITHLATCQDVYHPSNLDSLNERVGEYVSEKERLEKRLEELENLNEKDKKKHWEEIGKLKQKIKEQEKIIAEKSRGWFERMGALLGEGVDNTIEAGKQLATNTYETAVEVVTYPIKNCNIT